MPFTSITFVFYFLPAFLLAYLIAGENLLQPEISFSSPPVFSFMPGARPNMFMCYCYPWG